MGWQILGRLSCEHAIGEVPSSKDEDSADLLILGFLYKLAAGYEPLNFTVFVKGPLAVEEPAPRVGRSAHAPSLSNVFFRDWDVGRNRVKRFVSCRNSTSN